MAEEEGCVGFSPAGLYLMAAALTIRLYRTGIWGDFPGGPVVKNPPCDAGVKGLIPGQGTKIPHAMEQLSPANHNH